MGLLESLDFALFSFSADVESLPPNSPGRNPFFADSRSISRYGTRLCGWIGERSRQLATGQKNKQNAHIKCQTEQEEEAACEIMC